jgi:hypothetical protein
VRSDIEPFFIGKIADWLPKGEDFVSDSEIVRKDGYEKIDQDKSEAKIKEIYEKARSQGRCLIIRSVGVPIEPTGISSASLLAPNHTELFDAKVDYDKGALIYEISEESAKTCFNLDARTHIFNIKDNPVPKSNESVIDLGGGLYIYYDKQINPVSLADLQTYATSSTPDATHYYSEVIFDPNNSDCKLVGIVNPYDVWGWSKIAYKTGVPEFSVIPEFAQKSKLEKQQAFEKLSNV